MTMERLIEELVSKPRIPGLANVFVPPIRNRIDMLATGIKSPVGVKISGPDLTVLERLGREVAETVKPIDGTASAVSDRIGGGRYIDIDVNRLAAARYGLSLEEVQRTAAIAVGGAQIGEKIEARALPDQRALPARDARQHPGAAPTAAGRPQRRRGPAIGGRRHPRHDRAVDDPQRDRPAVGVNMSELLRPALVLVSIIACVTAKRAVGLQFALEVAQAQASNTPARWEFYVGHRLDTSLPVQRPMTKNKDYASPLLST